MNTSASVDEMGSHTASSPSPAPIPTPQRGSQPPRSRRNDLIGGTQAMLPWLVGVVPFGMVVGMTARTSDTSTALGLATGATIYSGSAQLTAIGLIGDVASIAVVVASVLIINARLVLYSSSIGTHWRSAGPGFRSAAAYLLVDPSYVVGMHRYEADSHENGGPHLHDLAAGVTLWVAWHAGMVAGAMVGGGLPEWLPLEHAVGLFLLAEAIQAVRARPALAAATTAGVVAIAGTSLPLHSGLLVAVVAGGTAGFRSCCVVTSCVGGHPLRSPLRFRPRACVGVGGDRPRRPVPGVVAVAPGLRRGSVASWRALAVRGQAAIAVRASVRRAAARGRRSQLRERTGGRRHHRMGTAHRRRSRIGQPGATGVGTRGREQNASRHRPGGATRGSIRSRLGARHRRRTVPARRPRTMTPDLALHDREQVPSDVCLDDQLLVRFGQSLPRARNDCVNGIMY